MSAGSGTLTKKSRLTLFEQLRRLMLSLLCLAPLANVNAASVPVGFVDRHIYSGFSSPTAMTVLPDGRILVLQQGGEVRMVKNDTLLPGNFYRVQNVEVFVETGCLGITADPNFLSNGYVYFYCTVQPNAGQPSHNRILRVTASGDAAVAGSERVILDFPPILPDADDGSKIYTHLGGAMRFGSDGKLYVGVGGQENSRILPPSRSYSQKLDNPFGKLLRINPDPANLFPSDNPYFNTPGAYQGIYAFGLRNPYTMDVQRSTGRLYINDVGAGTWEEVLEAAPRANYAWPNYDGDSNEAGHTNAIYKYQHVVDDSGVRRCAITGGAFYDPLNVRFPGSYIGKYLFNDFCTGRIHMIDPANPTGETVFASGLAFPVGLSAAPDGSLYYLSRSTAISGYSTTPAQTCRALHSIRGTKRFFWATLPRFLLPLMERPASSGSETV
jgi:glucose/arabinose dehydrogenase